MTWRRNFVPVTRRSTVRALRTCSPSYSSSTVAAWVSDSISRTPGIRGTSGKCPWKNSSLTVTFLTAEIRRPGSNADTASTSPTGYRWQRRSRTAATSIALAGSGHGYFFGAAGFGAAALAASRRRITSAVRSRPASAHTRPESAWLNSSWSPFSRGHRLDHRTDLALEVELQLVLQVLQLGLGVLRHALDVDLGLVDVLLDLGRGRFAHDGAALLGLQRLDGLVLLGRARRPSSREGPRSWRWRSCPRPTPRRCAGC